jgi:hypothetical protein
LKLAEQIDTLQSASHSAQSKLLRVFCLMGAPDKEFPVRHCSKVGFLLNSGILQQSATCGDWRKGLWLKRGVRPHGELFICREYLIYHSVPFPYTSSSSPSPSSSSPFSSSSSSSMLSSPLSSDSE